MNFIHIENKPGWDRKTYMDYSRYSAVGRYPCYTVPVVPIEVSSIESIAHPTHRQAQEYRQFYQIVVLRKSINFLIRVRYLARALGYRVGDRISNTEFKVEFVWRCQSNHRFYKPEPKNVIENRYWSYVLCHICDKKQQDEEAKHRKHLELQIIANDRNFSITGVYQDNNTEIEMRCPESHIIQLLPRSFITGSGCYVCRESLGEQLIRATLNHLGLEFISQYVLQKRKYDFVIISPTIVIEWDGGQHFSQCTLYHRDENHFKQQQQIDILKTQRILDYRCKMIRIDYTWLSKSVDAISQFINDCIHTSQYLTVSTPSMYVWLTSKVVIPSRMRLVIRSYIPVTAEDLLSFDSGTLVRSIDKFFSREGLEV
jgi:very-short-patch-repair endonuclease